jgi:hypothetical protein
LDERRGNDTAFAQVLVWDDTTGLAGELSPERLSGFVLGPNPARSVASVRFSLSGGEPVELRLYDITGSLVQPGRVVKATSGGPTAVQLDLRGLPAGVYFANLRHGSEELSRKLVIQR